MTFLERDPWRRQYFDGVESAPEVAIPTDDPDAYALNPAHRWVYNKLLVAESQGLPCGPHGVPPDRFPVFSKPIYNLRGMGAGSRVIADADEYAATMEPGHLWMALLSGAHVSTDVAVVDGGVWWLRHTVGAPRPGGTFDHWVVESAERPELAAYCRSWVERHLNGYTGMVNLETIGGRIIEVHLRFADQWPDLYGAGWTAAVARLYATGAWSYREPARVDGYSVVLFGPHGRDYRHPPPDALSRLLTSLPLSSVQVTFTEGAHAHAMPPGGFRLAIVNTLDLEAGRTARRRLAQLFGVDDADEVPRPPVR